MTIQKIVHEGKMVWEVSKIKRFSCINVCFINNLGQEDETQLTAENILTYNGCCEFERLFYSLSPELNTKPDSITSLTVIGSADTKEKLIEMGF